MVSLDARNVLQRCEEHFNRLYSPLDKTDTVMCPAFFQFDYKSPTEENASGYSESMEKIEHTLLGDEAERLVFDALKKSAEPMFVIRGLKFTSFLQSIIEGDNFINFYLGELDFVIIHWKVGVLLVEVKSKYSNQNYGKAIRQLKNGEKIIGDLLKVIVALRQGEVDEIQIPVYKICAAPNDDIPWVPEKNFKIGEKLCKEQQEVLHELCSVLVGQKTEITTRRGQRQFSDQVLPYKLLKENRGAIDSQSFLKQSHEKEVPKKKEKETGKQERNVVSTKNQPHLSILTGQFLFLNGEQLAIWEGPLRQVINGPPGFGKTILLQYKALECARKGEQVRVYVPRSLVILYKNFFKKHGCDEHIVTVQPLEIDSGKPDFCLSDQKCHIFIDEFQQGLSLVAQHKFLFPEVGVHKTPDEVEKYFWIVYNNMQLAMGCFYPNEFRDTRCFGIVYLWLAHVKEVGFQETVKHTCVRSTLNIQKFFLWFMKYSRITEPDEFISLMVSGHNILGPKVSVYLVELKGERVPVLSFGYGFIEDNLPSSAEFCGTIPANESILVSDNKISFNKEPGMTYYYNINGDKVYRNEEPCFTFPRMFPYIGIAEVIKKELESSTAPQTFSDTAVFVLGNVGKMSKAITDKGIPVCRTLCSGSNAVYVGLGFDVHSYQWNTVIVVCPWKFYSLDYTMLTRAISKLVVIFDKNLIV